MVTNWDCEWIWPTSSGWTTDATYTGDWRPGNVRMAMDEVRMVEVVVNSIFFWGENSWDTFILSGKHWNMLILFSWTYQSQVGQFIDTWEYPKLVISGANWQWVSTPTLGLAVKDPGFPSIHVGIYPPGIKRGNWKSWPSWSLSWKTIKWWISIAMFDYWRISILISVSIFKRQKHHHLA